MPHPAKPLPAHGGDLLFATRLYGQPEGGWLDLSTGINPNPYPAPPVPPEALHRLPDREALLGLLEVARRAYRVPDGVMLVAVPGTEFAIRFLATFLPPGKTAVVAPTYGTYADAWPHAVFGAAISEGTDVGIVVSPNNPDGRITPPAELPQAKWLIVDEAFADVAPPEASAIPSMRMTNRIVLRSVGKFYGLAGLRLGFVAAMPGVARQIEHAIGDWPVSGPAIAIGTAALADEAWRNDMRAQLKTGAQALRSLLTAHGLTVVGGTDLFVLAETTDAHALHRALAERGVWTRAFADHPRWIRFGLPGAKNFDRLRDVLRAAT